MTLATSKNLTILGILTIVSGLCVAGIAVFDGKPETNVDLGLLFATLSTGVGMILAKGAKSTGGTVDAAGNPITPAP